MGAEPAVRDRYQRQVMAALGAVDVRSPGSFLWFGRRVATPAPTARIDEALARELLVQRIEQQLYADFYSAGSPRWPRRGPVTPADDGGAFVRTLSQANCGRGSWQLGWHVAAVDGDTIAVVRPDGLRLLAPVDDCRVEGSVSAGAYVGVRVPKELKGHSPGFYVALGDTPSPAVGRADDLLRLCWSVAAAGAATLVARVSYALNAARLPFSLELLDNPARYERHAAASLFIAKTDFVAAIKILRPLLRALGPHLTDAAPAFTKPLTRGLALAEEPADGSSFGEHRCHLLAEAIVRSSELGLRSTEQRLAAVREQFRVAGLTLDAPYLGPGSTDAYERS